MFFVPTNIEMFGICPCKILSMFFVIAKCKCVTCWIKARFERSNPTCHSSSDVSLFHWSNCWLIFWWFLWVKNPLLIEKMLQNFKPLFSNIYLLQNFNNLGLFRTKCSSLMTVETINFFSYNDDFFFLRRQQHPLLTRFWTQKRKMWCGLGNCYSSVFSYLAMRPLNPFVPPLLWWWLLLLQRQWPTPRLGFDLDAKEKDGVRYGVLCSLEYAFSTPFFSRSTP